MRDDVVVVKWLERFAPVPKWRDDGTPITKQWEIKDVRFIVKEAWLFMARDASEKPLDFLNEIYDQRMQYKRATPYDAREKFYELPINSIYGKMAQRVGGSMTVDGRKPRPPQTHSMRRRSRPIVAGDWSKRACMILTPRSRS